ncbi:MAG TPA: putative beta-lysine N-acetyltransferase [Desulfotomaculum sp.]|nr:putative beta-lysine N-acetyltransferase [Desulfotomaculum sp.]
MSDTIETLGFSQIQHGKENNRIYLMKYDTRDQAQIITQLEHLALKAGYTKILAKIPQSVEELFSKVGYRREAKIPRYKNGREDHVFMGKYFDEQRAVCQEQALIGQVLSVAQSKSKSNSGLPSLPSGMQMRALSPSDAPAMADVYKQVFETYPFPIHDPDYLIQKMGETIVYFGVFLAEQLIALASSETDSSCLNSEMTDFATLEAYRGQNLSLILLLRMEEEMRCKGFKTLYTIARAVDFGINATFAKAGYIFDGTLVNNTNISGKIESMNVWHKEIQTIPSGQIATP